MMINYVSLSYSLRWPAMVEADPDTGLYYEAERESGKTSPATPVGLENNSNF